MSDPLFHCVCHDQDIYTHADIGIHKHQSRGQCHIMDCDDDHVVIDSPNPEGVHPDVTYLMDGRIVVEW